MSECHSSCTSALRYMIPACNNVYNTLINSQNKLSHITNLFKDERYKNVNNIHKKIIQKIT